MVIKITSWRPYLAELFQILSVGGAVLVILELLAPRAVLSVINLSAWFLLWLISGIILLVGND